MILTSILGGAIKGSLFRIGVIALCFAGLSPLAGQGAKFLHASLGPVEIYTSASVAETSNFVAELLEVRRQVQDLVGPAPLPNQRLQVIVFSNRKDYEAFAPSFAVEKELGDVVSGFTSNEFALTAGVIRGNDSFSYEFGKDVILYFYAQHLLRSAMPSAPLWVLTGLPELLAGINVRQGKLWLGADPTKHAEKMRSIRLIPLADLMNDSLMRHQFDAPKHDTALYRQSWALWHRWLANREGARRAEVRAVFDAIRTGGAGNLVTVTKVFGESSEMIETEHRKTAGRIRRGEVVVNDDVGSLIGDLKFTPATELDRNFALAVLFARRGEGMGMIGVDLMRLADDHPESPRPQEALAMLAASSHDTETTASRWRRARELGTDNPYAYASEARQRIGQRKFLLNLRAQLPSGLTEDFRGLCRDWRKWDGGSLEAQLFQVIIEAFADAPSAEVLASVEHERLVVADQRAAFYLAIARWRLGETDAAVRMLDDVALSANLSAHLRENVETVRALMTK